MAIDYVGWGVAGGVFVLLLLSNLLYVEALYSYTLSVAPDIQTTFADIISIYQSISDLGTGELYVFLSFLVLPFISLSDTLIYSAIWTLNEAIVGSLKLMYHDGRPYLDSDDITTTDCSLGFGNPSGHSMMAASFSVYTMLDLT